MQGRQHHNAPECTPEISRMMLYANLPSPIPGNTAQSLAAPICGAGNAGPSVPRKARQSNINNTFIRASHPTVVQYLERRVQGGSGDKEMRETESKRYVKNVFKRIELLPSPSNIQRTRWLKYSVDHIQKATFHLRFIATKQRCSTYKATLGDGCRQFWTEGFVCTL